MGRALTGDSVEGAHRVGDDGCVRMWPSVVARWEDVVGKTREGDDGELNSHEIEGGVHAAFSDQHGESGGSEGGAMVPESWRSQS